MIKVRVINKFTLKDYAKLKNVSKLVNSNPNEFNKGDTFECDEAMAKYLTGDNALNMVAVEVLEVIEEPKEEPKKEVKIEPKVEVKKTKKK